LTQHLRRSVLAVALGVAGGIASATAPALVETVAGTPLGWLAPSRAHAQDATTKLAREKFLEGVKAYDAERFEEARVLFLQAYALKRHPAVLLNLGLSEIKSGYVVEGGNHLQQFLREHKEAKPEQRTAAGEGIADAQKKAGWMIVMVDKDGAVVGLDGQPVGKSPLVDPIFLAPGKHQASATLDDKTIVVQFEAKRGQPTPVQLSFELGGSVPLPAPVPVPVPAPSPAPPPPSPSPTTTSALPPAPPPILVGSPPPIPPDKAEPKGRMGVIEWFKQRPVAWVTFGLAGAGLIGTIAFGAAAGVANTAAADVEDQILAHVAREQDLPPQYYQDGQPKPCGSQDKPESAHPNYRQACDQLRDNIDAYNADLVGLGVSLAVFGAATAATVIYYFVDSKRPARSATAAPSVTVVPLVGTRVQGLGIAGSF
jgi:hypothetical protein